MSDVKYSLGEIEEAIRLMRRAGIQSEGPTDDALILALVAAVRAAMRVNELVGTETEEGQAEAWEALDAALAKFAE